MNYHEKMARAVMFLESAQEVIRQMPFLYPSDLSWLKYHAQGTVSAAEYVDTFDEHIAKELKKGEIADRLWPTK